MKTTRIRAKILVGFGAASLALGVAGTASAQPTAPVNKDGKEACAIIKGTDEKGEPIVVWIDHGGTKTNPNGSRWTCEDGVWVGARASFGASTYDWSFTTDQGTYYIAESSDGTGTSDRSYDTSSQTLTYYQPAR